MEGKFSFDSFNKYFTYNFVVSRAISITTSSCSFFEVMFSDFILILINESRIYDY